MSLYRLSEKTLYVHSRCCLFVHDITVTSAQYYWDICAKGEDFSCQLITLQRWHGLVSHYQVVVIWLLAKFIKCPGRISVNAANEATLVE